MLSEIELEVSKKRLICEKCGSVLVRNGRDKRKIKTLVGEVETNRARLHPQRCGLDIYPFDDAIGLSGREHTTLGVRERSLWAATEVISYEKANSFLKKFSGLEVSRKKIHMMAIEEGRMIELWQEKMSMTSQANPLMCSILRLMELG